MFVFMTCLLMKSTRRIMNSGRGPGGVWELSGTGLIGVSKGFGRLLGLVLWGLEGFGSFVHKNV